MYMHASSYHSRVGGQACRASLLYAEPPLRPELELRQWVCASPQFFPTYAGQNAAATPTSNGKGRYSNRSLNLFVASPSGARRPRRRITCASSTFGWASTRFWLLLHFCLVCGSRGVDELLMLSQMGLR